MIEATQHLAAAADEIERRWQDRRVWRWLIIAVSMAIGVGIGALLMAPSWIGSIGY